MDWYRRFAESICDPGYLHFDELAAQQIYTWESLGRRRYHELFQSEQIDERNGFHHGKRWMEITVAGWREELPRLDGGKIAILTRAELQEDFEDEFLRLKGIL